MWKQTKTSLKEKKPKTPNNTVRLYCFRNYECAPISPRLCKKKKINLPAGTLRRVPYQERPAQPLAISVLPAVSYLCAMNNQVLDIIRVWHSE